MIDNALLILAAILLLIVLALVYWLYQAHKAAQRNRRAFEPLPQASSDHDREYIDRRLRELDENPPAFLRRQAD